MHCCVLLLSFFHICARLEDKGGYGGHNPKLPWSSAEMKGLDKGTSNCPKYLCVLHIGARYAFPLESCPRDLFSQSFLYIRTHSEG